MSNHSLLCAYGFIIALGEINISKTNTEVFKDKFRDIPEVSLDFFEGEDNVVISVSASRTYFSGNLRTSCLEWAFSFDDLQNNKDTSISQESTEKLISLLRKGTNKNIEEIPWKWIICSSSNF